MPYLAILIGIVVVLIVWVVIIFNSLIRQKNRMKNAWSDIDVQLKRRYDLIPNLVEIVKGYSGYEASVLEKLTNARTNAIDAKAKGATLRGDAEEMLSGALKTIFAVAENYPDLKAAANFKDLQGQLATLEEDIQSARRYYNAAVRELNNAVQVFPANIVAGLFAFSQAEFFGIDEGEKKSVKVSF